VGIEARHLRVTYDHFVAVADTTLAVDAGESFGIVGESGSGKSTVLRALCGLVPAGAGTIRLVANAEEGRRAGHTSECLPAPGTKAFRRLVQMVFQDRMARSTHGRRSTGSGRAAGEPRHCGRRGRIERALDEVGLGPGFTRYPHQLSGGSASASRWPVRSFSSRKCCSWTGHVVSTVQAEVLNLLEDLPGARLPYRGEP
jgi:peptide/nickel transport system ATP-binding protein